MLEDNLSILMERFPKLGLLAPSWPVGDCAREALDTVDPGKADAVYVYGIGRGAPYFQLRGWLRGDKERKLIFLEDDHGSFGTWLLDEDAGEVLSDPQVQFSQKGDWHTLAEQFPLKRIEVVALPSRKGARFRALRLDLLRKTTLSHALYLDRLHGYQPMQNFVRNLRHLPNSFYANRLECAFKGVPAIVCGAGPSLQRAMPHLKQLEGKALLIAGGSTIAALSSQGVLPHFGMAIDPNLEEYRRMRNSFAFEVPLLYSTRVFPAIFQTCNGPFGYMRSGIGGINEIWMEEELGLLDPLIGENLSSESISVTAICTAWAQFLGCNPILFCGVDLAYTGKKRYAEGVAEEEEIPFALLDAEKSAADRILKRKDRNGQQVFTAVRWVMESASLSHFAKKHKEVQFLNTTEGGIGIKGVPFIPLSEAVEKYLARTSDLRAQVHEQIAKAPMPANTAEVIDCKMGELRESLDRIVAHLEVLAGKRGGSKPLAEIELQDEMAMPYLFYDIEDLLSRMSAPSESKWSRFLDLAMKYKVTLS
jgi:hypothetical protein